MAFLLQSFECHVNAQDLGLALSEFERSMLVITSLVVILSSCISFDYYLGC